MTITDEMLREKAEKMIFDKPKYVQERYSYVAQETKLNYHEIYDKSKIGIITSAKYGVNDRNHVRLSFSIDLGSSGCGAQASVDITTELLMDYDVEDVKDLIGKPIYVLDIPTDNRIFWLEACKITVEK